MTKPRWTQIPGSGAVEADNPGEFLEEARSKGWRVALENLWGSTSPGIFRTTSPSRTSWKFLFPIGSSWKVLDIGAGTGGVACRLAKDCYVTAVDAAWCDAEFVKIRAEQEGLSLEVIVADAISLPLASNTFDLALMIGSLEWIPFGHPDAPPEETQLHALQEAFRVLKPGGSLYLGIENRLFLDYYFGSPDPHTGIKYIPLLDRGEAERLSQDVRGRPYLELTYSREEGLAVLQKVGFHSIRAYWLYPEYVCTNCFIPLDNLNVFSYFIKNLFDINPSLYSLYQLLPPEVLREHVGYLGFTAVKND